MGSRVQVKEQPDTYLHPTRKRDVGVRPLSAMCVCVCVHVCMCACVLPCYSKGSVGGGREEEWDGFRAEVGLGRRVAHVPRQGPDGGKGVVGQ